MITEDYTDNCDYSNMEPNLYFEYDILKKLGEADFEWYPDQSKTHGYSYWFHYFPKGGEDWIIFMGNFGADWYSFSIYDYRSPVATFFGESHEWKNFSIDYSFNGFGNDPSSGNVYWISDSPIGDVW